MLRRLFVLTAIVLVLSPCQIQAAQISVTWDGGGDGLYWGDAANWSPDVVPNNTVADTFAVLLEGKAEIGCGQSSQLVTIDSLECRGDVDIDVYWHAPIFFTVLNGINNTNNLYLEDLWVFANITNAPAGATLTLDGTEIEGTLVNALGADIVITDMGTEIDDGGLQNAGTVVIRPDGSLEVTGHIDNSGRIDIFGGCEADQILNQQDGILQGSSPVIVEELLQNQGSIIAKGGALKFVGQGILTNTGTLASEAHSELQLLLSNDDLENLGRVVVGLGGGIVFDCNLVNEPNAVIKLLGGTLAATTITQKADANFAGFGGISGDVVIDPNGLIQLTGPTNVVGDVTISPNATLEVSDGLTLITGHTTCNGTIRMLGGYIIPQGGLSGSCNVIWEPGLYINIADFNLDGHVNLKDFALFADTWLWQSNWH